MRRFARQHAGEFFERQKGAPGEQLTEKEAMNIALQAQRAARRRLRKVTPRSKRSRKK